MAEQVENAFAMLTKIAIDIVSSPLNLVLVAVCGVLLYKIINLKRESAPSMQREAEPPPMKKRDFTLEQLREFDGRSPNGRVLVAVNGKVFDATRGKRFYGPGGPYSAFAGRDASRGLATFQVEANQDKYDDLSDLNSMQMESVKEWEMQFTEKYDYVGRLLKPGEEPNDYSDEDDSTSQGGTKSGGENENTPTKKDQPAENETDTTSKKHD